MMTEPAGVEGAVEGRVNGIACLWIPVADVAVSQRWHSEVLGLEVLRGAGAAAGSSALLRLSPEGPGLFLQEVDRPTPTHFDRDGSRTAMFELRVDDIQAFQARVQEQGVRV